MGPPWKSEHLTPAAATALHCSSIAKENLIPAAATAFQITRLTTLNMFKKCAKNDPEMSQNLFKMVPGTPLGSPRDPLGVQGETQELHLHLPRSIFKDFGSLLGSLGDHIFFHFGALFSTLFWRSLLRQFWIHMVTILDPFWKLF